MQPRIRAESFGGIVGLTDPPALVFVDRDYMRGLGVDDSPLWHTAPGHLSAPTEVHFNLTRRCNLRCRFCTTDAGPGEEQELGTAEVFRALDTLAALGVFHVAFGGGELFLRSDAIEIARYARARGLIPNATTNGHCLTPELARECGVFGQVNVSLDGVGEQHGAVRGAGDFDTAVRALRWLVAAGVATGVNCVVTRHNFAQLPELVAEADGLGLREVLLLRLKPSGRARGVYHEYALSAEQGRQLYPVLQRVSRKARVALQVDCSFVPHLCAHRPSLRAMRVLGVEGCGGGDMLLGVNPAGAVNACSHYPESVGHVLELPSLWGTHAHFGKFRARRVADPRCRSCRYVQLCKGGCPLFSEFLAGDFNAADPECPRLAGR